MNFIGSQDGATRSFILHIPGQLRTISSTTTDILLQDLGICSSSSINVTWQEEVSFCPLFNKKVMVCLFELNIIFG